MIDSADFEVLNLPKVYCVSMEPSTKVPKQSVEIIDGIMKGALGYIVRRSDRSQRVMVELSTPFGTDYPVGERVWFDPGQWRHVKAEVTRDQRIQAAKDRLIKPDLMVDGSRPTAPTAKPSRTGSKVGRKSLADSLTPEELEGQVQELLAELRKSDDPDDQKRIRRALRLRGLRGGLRGE